MYNLVKDALFTPKNLLAYRNKSGFFVFMYLVVLSLLISIGGAIHFLSYQGNSVITSETTGCTLTAGQLSCAAPVHDPNNQYALFGYAVYFLNPDETLTNPVTTRMVFQGNSLSLTLESGLSYPVDLRNLGLSNIDFDEFFRTFSLAIQITSLLFVIISNFVIMIGVSLVATIPFFRLKQFIPYKKIFRLVVFAMTPFALLLTFYYLLEIPEIVFIILMFISYRSVFVLQRVMTQETFLHLADLAAQNMTIDPSSPEDNESESTQENSFSEEDDANNSNDSDHSEDDGDNE